MGKAISELDSYAGPMSGTTKLPVSDGDTLKTATASQVKTYIEGEIGTAQFRALLDDVDAAAQRTTLGLGDAATKNVGTTTGTVAAGDHGHSTYAATGAIGSSGLTMATAKLLGRSTAGTGAPEEITLGTNLSFSGTTLNAAGGGGTPGGSDTQVQFNDGGVFAGNSAFTFNKTTLAVTLGPNSSSVNTSSASSSAAQNYFDIKSGANWNDQRIRFYTGSTLKGAITRYAIEEMRIVDNNGFAVDPGLSYPAFVVNSIFVGLGAAWPLRWSSIGQASNSSDTGLARDAAGVLKVTDGGTSNLRDLKARNLIGTGNLATGTVAKSANYTATTSDGTIEVDASGAARTITLFAASGNAGKIIVVKKTDSSANAVTVDGNASETIDGAATISLASQYSTAILQVNAAGTGWNKLGGV